MKNLIATTCVLALISSQAMATDTVEPPTEEPRSESSGSNAGVLILFGVLVGGALLYSQRETSSGSAMNAPRPLIRPEGCLNKINEITGC